MMFFQMRKFRLRNPRRCSLRPLVPNGSEAIMAAADPAGPRFPATGSSRGPASHRRVGVTALCNQPREFRNRNFVYMRSLVCSANSRDPIYRNSFVRVLESRYADTPRGQGFSGTQRRSSSSPGNNHGPRGVASAEKTTYRVENSIWKPYPCSI